jgi:hypothetical protein
LEIGSQGEPKIPIGRSSSDYRSGCMGRSRRQKSRNTPTHAVDFLKLLGVIALLVVLLAHRITRIIGFGHHPARPNGATLDNTTPGEAISPADKRALDRAIQDGSQH